MDNPAERLVSLLGGRSAAAAAFDVSREAIRKWLLNGIPTARAVEAETKTKGKRNAVKAAEILQYHAERKA